MPSFNNFSGVGHAASDPSYYPPKDDKKSFLRITVAFNTGYKDEPPLFLELKCFGFNADILQNVQKGDAIYVLGAILKQDKYEDKNGVSRTSYYLVPTSSSSVSAVECGYWKNSPRLGSKFTRKEASAPAQHKHQTTQNEMDLDIEDDLNMPF